MIPRFDRWERPMKSSPPASPDFLRPFAAQVEEFLRKELFGRDLGRISVAVEYQLGGGGKRLRPALTLWLASAMGLRSDQVLPLAGAMELLHNVLLIHDDIQDGDHYRREQKTLWVEVGVAEAINAADFLLAEAFRLVASGDAPADVRLRLAEIFAECLRITVEGQALDLAWRATDGFGLEAYEEIIRKKTGRYLACGWVGVAILAGQESATEQGLWAVGDQLGPAFQIRDDRIDLTVGKGRGGELGCDVREGKPSILVAFALERGELSEADRSELLSILRRPREETDPEAVRWVTELYRSCGALAFADREAVRRARAGIESFEELSLVGPEERARFREVAEFLVEREV